MIPTTQPARRLRPRFRFTAIPFLILPLVCGLAAAAAETTDPAATGRAEPNPIIDPNYREFVVVEGKSPHESRLQVRVLDGDGRPIRDLELGDFEVSFEDGRCPDGRGLEALVDPAAGGDGAAAAGRLRDIAASDCLVVSFRPPGPARRILAIAVDISGSVIGRDPDGAIPETSMRRLAERIRTALSELFEEDDLYLFGRFSSRFVIDGPTTDAAALEQVLLRPWNRRWEPVTPYYSMVKVLADTLKRYPDSPKAILIFSDCAPSDHPGEKLDGFVRETEEQEKEVREILAAASARLKAGTVRISESSLEQTLSLGVPVYNINFPEPFPNLRYQSIRDCRAWIRRTGGDSFPLPNPARDIPDIFETVRDAADGAYQVAVRHDAVKNGAVRIRVVDRPGLEVLYSHETVSLGTRRESLLFKINNGGPQERLEAVHFAAQFDHPDIRRGLVTQLEREPYEPVREALGQSLQDVLIRAICGDREIHRARATNDIYRVLPYLPESRRRAILLGPLGACPDYPAYRDYLFEWWKAERDPQVQPSLYAANIVSIQYDLERGDFGPALNRAGKMGGDPVRVLLEEFLRSGDPPADVVRRIEKILSGLEPF